MITSGPLLWAVQTGTVIGPVFLYLFLSEFAIPELKADIQSIRIRRAWKRYLGYTN